MQGTKRVLIRPLVTEKSNMVTEKQNKYVFIVDRTSTKAEIKSAVETYFNVEGRKSAAKKAYITIKEGSTIDIYS
jgi:large subunit ribosomal protein L23